MAKMNPPLRTEWDRQAVIEGLTDGTIDVIATDHAPHAAWEKAKSIEDAPFGITGLETGFAVSYSMLVIPGILTLSQLVDKMSCGPARLIGLPGGAIEVGAPADLMLFDGETPFLITGERFVSKGKCTPFEGMTARGHVIYTICDGILCYDDHRTVHANKKIAPSCLEEG
jgi:dihydroorotase